MRKKKQKEERKEVLELNAFRKELRRKYLPDLIFTLLLMTVSILLTGRYSSGYRSREPDDYDYYKADIEELLLYDYLLRRGRADKHPPEMLTPQGKEYMKKYLKLYFKACVPPSEKCPYPDWLCPCGRQNPHYTYTCACGKNKREGQPVAEPPSEPQEPPIPKPDLPDLPDPPERPKPTVSVTVDRSGETITCPNCRRRQNKTRTFCYNCNAAFPADQAQ